jgi:hypothetical protein
MRNYVEAGPLMFALLNWIYEIHRIPNRRRKERRR